LFFTPFSVEVLPFSKRFFISFSSRKTPFSVRQILKSQPRA
jgi:hypothetical protein